MTGGFPLVPGQILKGPLFAEPVRVVTVESHGDESWTVGVAGIQTERFRQVSLSLDQLKSLTVVDAGCTYDADGQVLKLGLQAHCLKIAYEYDPYFGLSISRVDPLPHQLEAVYEFLLKLARVRFLLADDAGAGKTIMAGLLLRELELRGLAERVLVVCPANLAFQWQRELSEKFDEKFVVMKGQDIRYQFGVNQWLEKDRIITSLDLAKRADILPGLEQVDWDLVVVDEAHRMSASDESHKSQRYRLGEMLRDRTDHILLLTATPHKGDPANFSLFLQLLDQDAYADVRSINEAMEKRHAPFYLRRTKEAMVYFPRQMEDGSWVAKKIFTKRIPHSAGFTIDDAEFELYRSVTGFVKMQSIRAAEMDESARARAVGFLMALYQRRLASSTRAMRRSLENRARRLDENLSRAQELAGQAPPTVPDPEEFEEMEDAERERLEQILEAVTISQNADQIHEEIGELEDLARQALEVEESGTEAKLSKLRTVLQDQGFFDRRDQRLLIFTEFKDTLDYLVERLREWGFEVGYIHGNMKPGSRDEPDTRLFMEQQFKDAAIQVLVATEAAGEGINLQACNIMFNYDIPWNPNRLEQRMGRIHRYGQEKDCLIFNFVATNTIEGQVLEKLLTKLQKIRDALDDDAVFNVVGEVLPAAHIERVLRDYYSGSLSEEDLEERMLRNVDEEHFKGICQTALEGLATKRLNLEMLIERRALATERRIVPETIARFIQDVSPRIPMRVKLIPELPYTFKPDKTPSTLKRFEQDPDWKLAGLANEYPRCSTDRETAEKNNLEWVTPGHPFFEALRRFAYDVATESFGRGACFHSLQFEEPARIDFYSAKVVDGLGDTIHEKVFAVEIRQDTEPVLVEQSVLGDCTPCAIPGDLPPVAFADEALPWLRQIALLPFLEEARGERLEELDRIAEHVELSLTELIEKADGEIGRADAEVQQKVTGAEGRLAQAQERHDKLLHRRDRRRREIEQQRSLTLQGVSRLASVIVLPHPESEDPEVKRLRPDPETEAIAMRVAMEHESSLGRKVEDVHEKNLGYDVKSVDLVSGELRLIEVKGIKAPTGDVILTPNERRVAEDRRDCFWLYVVSNCGGEPVLRMYKDPAQYDWQEVIKVQHYTLSLNSLVE